ncbi:MAG: MBL fold metallo-hydrolase [Vicinamibacterales bacterium]
MPPRARWWLARQRNSRAAAQPSSTRRREQAHRLAWRHQGWCQARLQRAARTIGSVAGPGERLPSGGGGANVAVLVGDDGVLLVDSGAEAASDRIISELRKLSPDVLRWIINTSADMDHTGGNAKVAKAGEGPQPDNGARGTGFNGFSAAIISFENVLNRMSAPVGQTASRDVDAWPTDTFFTSKKSIWFDGEPIEILHQSAAHADGDVMVFFRRSDVIAAGDILTTDRYPFFDAQKGGSIQGLIDGLNRIIDIAIPRFNQQGGTRIIPGHGRICNESDVVEYRDMATIVRDRIQALAKSGMTLEQVKAAHPTLDYDGIYGAATGSWTTDMFIEAVYKEVMKSSVSPTGSKARAKTPVKK